MCAFFLISGVKFVNLLGCGTDRGVAHAGEDVEVAAGVAAGISAPSLKVAR